MYAPDQFFEPGDKVMRVAYASEFHNFFGSPPGGTNPATDYGNVLCVESCWPHPILGNRVSFVGIKTNTPNAWRAACFRKVDEIRLCQRALQQRETPVKV